MTQSDPEYPTPTWQKKVGVFLTLWLALGAVLVTLLLVGVTIATWQQVIA